MNSLRSLLTTSKTNKITPITSEMEEDPISINPTSKKITKFKREQYKDAKITYLGFPTKIDSIFQKTLKKWTIEVRFTDKEGRQRVKNIRFGNVIKPDFIDHQNETLKQQFLSKKNLELDNWLHPDFYKVYLLNTSPDINTAYKNLVSKLNPSQNSSF